MWNKCKNAQMVCNPTPEGDCGVVNQIRDLNEQCKKLQSEIDLLSDNSDFQLLGWFLALMIYGFYKEPNKSECETAVRRLRSSIRRMRIDLKDGILTQFSDVIKTEFEVKRKSEEQSQLSRRIDQLKESIGIK